MIKEQRRRLILEQVNENGSVSVQELEQLTGCSRATIRRDLDELAEEKLIRKVRGGAAQPEGSGRGVMSRQQAADSSFTEPSFRTRQSANLEEKQRIAQAAHSLVGPGETLLIGSGTTVYEFTKTLRDITPLYCATNDLQSAVTLAKFDNLDLTVLGGTVRRTHFSLHGYFTEDMIGQMHADKALIGIDAIDPNLGYMNFTTEDVATNRAMLRAARKKIVLCDHSKFDSIAFISICRLSDIDILITGSEASPENVQMLRNAGVEVITA